MSRPVSYNLIKKPLETDISMVDMPEGSMGEGFFATKLNNVIGLARKNSIWPLPFATSCCGIEIWLPWVLIMIWQGLVLKGWAFLPASVIC